MKNKIFLHLARKEYIEIMNSTKYGWKQTELVSKYGKIVGCPSDLPYISKFEEPYKGECHADCEFCWNYVLKNKKW